MSKREIYDKNIYQFYFSCEQLIAQNAQLRAQLEESHRTNESLTNDLQKLTNDWEALRDEMLSKEDEWKSEEEVKKMFYCTICWFFIAHEIKVFF